MSLKNDVESLLKYFEKHPEAEDSLEGVMRWWLTEVSIQQEVENVERALAELIRADLLEEVRHSEQPIRYRLKQKTVAS